jgi:hypothetical protein
MPRLDALWTWPIPSGNCIIIGPTYEFIDRHAGFIGIGAVNLQQAIIPVVEKYGIGEGIQHVRP